MSEAVQSGVATNVTCRIHLCVVCVFTMRNSVQFLPTSEKVGTHEQYRVLCGVLRFIIQMFLEIIRLVWLAIDWC